jgi:hypothetical protein
MEKERTMETKYTGSGMYEMDLRHVEMVQLTPERLRTIAQKRLITSGPGTDVRYMPTQNELDTISDMMEYAIKRGQLIQFGHWPNELIRKTAGHGGRLYQDGALAHPFSSPYLFMHTWNDEYFPIPEHLKGKGPKTSVYLVNPFPNGKEVFIDFEAMELEGFRIVTDDCVGICDRIVFHSELSTKLPVCEVTPFALRFPEIRNTQTFKTIMGAGVTIPEAAMANVLDPVMTALAILNTKGVRWETVVPNTKLARARFKTGKQPIPPYRRVLDAEYVTAILAKRERNKSEDHGGTHASPRPHVRMGHLRHYKSGERSIIRDTLVNATEDMRATFKSNRSHYVVKED